MIINVTTRMRHFTHFLGGFLTGVAAAATLVLLLTPQSGQRTREELQHELEAIIEEGQRAANQRRRELESRLQQLREGKDK